MAFYGAPPMFAQTEPQQPPMNWNPPPPLPSGVASPGIITTDITSKFIAAARTLEPGELVKDGFFTLFESVGALEIMDPKMDSGCLDPGEDFEEQYDVRRHLLPDEVLGIIDQLLCHEMAWHLGYPLSQTLFTSVYVEKILMPIPTTIQNADFIRTHDATSPVPPTLLILRAYIVGMLKACGYVNERVKSEVYYEEEDFVTNTYHRTLLENINLNSVLLCIQEARVQLQALRGSVADEIVEALDARLLMRYLFLQAIDHSQYTKEPERIRGPWSELNNILVQGKAALATRGTPVPESFSAKLQRKLASTMPPRPIVQLSFEDAFAHLTNLFQDALESVDVLNYTNSLCLLTFVSQFNSKKPQPLVFVRCLLQSFLFSDMVVLGNRSIRSILDDDLSTIVIPCSPLLDKSNDEVETPQDRRFIIAQQMEEFRQKAAQSYLEMLQTLCQNRCRVRRMLVHVVRGWDSLQVTAEEIDQILQAQMREQPMRFNSIGEEPMEGYSLPLSSWTYFHKLRQMEWIVQLGFELEVYQVDELAGMYWYLNHLAKLRVQHVERIKGFVLDYINSARMRDPHSQTMDREFPRTLAFMRLALLDAAITWELSDALSCLYAALQRLGLIKATARPYSTDELRYELRMRPFSSVGIPEMPTFTQFKEGTEQPETSPKEILEYAGKAVAGARKAFEALAKLPPEEAFSVGSHGRWLKLTKDGLKSSIATGIAISTLLKLVQKAGAGGTVKAEVTVPTPDKAYHEWWIVPTIVPAKD